jgi:O-antigen/teichoic acid export membrane protein
VFIAKLSDDLTKTIRLVVERWQSSQFVRDAALLLLFNVTSKVILFFGNAYAAKCLGPLNLGISALVQTTVQQVALTYHGGFDLVAVRKIAGERESCPDLTATIVSFRFCVAILVSIIWSIVCFGVISDSEKFIWLMGVPLILISATGINFAFQGLEKLPIQNAISTVSSFLGASAYFLFFSPGMFLGADLIVVSAVAGFTVVASWCYYFRIFKQWPVRPNILDSLFSLLRESWRYWILNVVVYFYSVFQIPLIAYLLDAREAGIYRSAFVMAAGLELLYNSINSLLLPRLVLWKEMGLSVMWERQSKLVPIFLLIGLTPVALLILGSEWIYRIFLGPEFKEGVIIFQILVFGRLLVFISQIYAWGLAATNQDLQLLLSTIVATVFSLSFNVLLLPHYGLVAAALTSLTSEFLVASCCYFFSKCYHETTQRLL